MRFKKYLFILSKLAAGGRNLPTEEEIRTYVKSGLDIRVVTTEYKGHTTKLAREFGEKNPGSVVVACGGDGTLREVAKGLYGTDAYLAILPCGSGNDFNRTVSNGLSWKDLLKKIDELETTKIDLIDVNGEICLNVWNFGFDADILIEAKKIQERFPFLGESIYLFGVLKSLFGKISSKLEYEIKLVSGEIKKGSGNYILGNIANGKYYGGGFNPAPFADVKDGILNFMIVDKMNVFELVSLINKYKKGEHIGLKKVFTEKVVSGKIKSLEGETTGSFDGDVVKFSEVSFKVLKDALNFAYYRG